MLPHIDLTFDEQVAIVTFYHPQKNSFTSKQLKDLSDTFDKLSTNQDITVVLLKSEGDIFCSGASFDELIEIVNNEKSKVFFSGFGRLLNSMKNCKKTIITAVQGKAVGGGVGIICASDYVIGVENAAIKLSELSIGFGPYVIEPFVSKKIGKQNSYHVTLNPNTWFNAKWCGLNHVFNEIVESSCLLEKSLFKAKELSLYNHKSLEKLKDIYWEDLSQYDKLYPNRANISGELILSPKVKKVLENFKKK